MTEIEIREAVIWLEDLKQKHAVTAHWWGACECALSALREKQEREKGCQRCRAKNYATVGVDENGVYLCGGNGTPPEDERFLF